MTTERSEKGIESTVLLGGGGDLAGRLVEYWGHVWTVTEKNYTGFWNVERYENRGDGEYKIRSSIAPNVSPENHPHFARLL